MFIGAAADNSSNPFGYFKAPLLSSEPTALCLFQTHHISVELKDIVKRNKIRDVDMLERIVANITSNIGTTSRGMSSPNRLHMKGLDDYLVDICA